MKRMYVAAGIALLATTSCNPLAARSNNAVTATVPAPPPATVYVTPTPEPTVPAFVYVPDLARRRVDVAVFLLNDQGLGHTFVGGGHDLSYVDNWQDCASIPRAGTRVGSGTRVALMIRILGC